MKRVYHPTLASFQDVPDDAVDEWAEAGWRKTAPKHINVDALPEIGSSPGVAAVPVLEADDYSAPPAAPRAAKTAAPRTAKTAAKTAAPRATATPTTGAATVAGTTA